MHILNAGQYLLNALDIKISFIRSVQNLVLQKLFFYSKDKKGRKMNQIMIKFLFVLTALPMVFSTCKTSNGNYVSHSVDVLYHIKF